ncbi:MAG: DUF5615 family PIN-like protein [Candidatus Binatia bacterium]
MKLLFDQNLSWRLCAALADYFPGSLHVRDVDLSSAADDAVWEFARQNDLTIVTKDVDFHQRSFVYGPPPRVVWVRRGNCSTDDVMEILVSRRDSIEAFCGDPEASFLVLR